MYSGTSYSIEMANWYLRKKDTLTLSLRPRCRTPEVSSPGRDISPYRSAQLPNQWRLDLRDFFPNMEWHLYPANFHFVFFYRCRSIQLQIKEHYSIHNATKSTCFTYKTCICSYANWIAIFVRTLFKHIK